MGKTGVNFQEFNTTPKRPIDLEKGREKVHLEEKQILP